MVKAKALKKRYILFQYQGQPMDEKAFKHALYDEALWAKYAGRDTTSAAGWAPK